MRLFTAKLMVRWRGLPAVRLKQKKKHPPSHFSFRKAFLLQPRHTVELSGSSFVGLIHLPRKGFWTEPSRLSSASFHCPGQRHIHVLCEVSWHTFTLKMRRFPRHGNYYYINLFPGTAVRPFFDESTKYAQKLSQNLPVSPWPSNRWIYLVLAHDSYVTKMLFEHDSRKHKLASISFRVSNLSDGCFPL